MAAIESVLQGDSAGISKVNLPLTQPGVHNLPPSPALTHSDTPTPTPTPGPNIDAETSTEAQSNTQLPHENADIYKTIDVDGTMSDKSNGSDSSFIQQIEKGVTTDVSDEPCSAGPPSVVLGDASPSDPETCWQITDVHTLRSQEQAVWEDSGIGTEHALDKTETIVRNNEITDGVSDFSYTAPYTQPQQLSESHLPQARLVSTCADLDTCQQEILHKPSTSDSHRYHQVEVTSSDQPQKPLLLGPGLPVKTGRPGSSENTHFKRLFQKGNEPDLKSGHIDHNLKPLQITHNFSDGKHPAHSGPGILRFRSSSKPANQSLDHTNAALLLKNNFHMKEKKSTSSSESIHCLGTDSSSGHAHFDFVSNQCVPKDNYAAQHVGFDGSARKVYAHPVNTSSSYQDFLNTSLEHHDYGLQPLSVEQYLFDCNDLPQFANIPTEDDLGGDMFELTPSIPPNALPSYAWQQRGWCKQKITSTPVSADPAIQNSLQTSLNSSGIMAPYHGISTISFESYDAYKTSYASNDTVDNSANTDDYHSANVDYHSVDDYGTTSFRKGSRSSKTAVIPAALTATGSDIIQPPAEIAEEPSVMWTAGSDLAPTSAHSLHRSDPVADALVSALGVDMHLNLTKMHSHGSPCPDPHSYQLHDNTGVEYSSTLLSPPVTPCPEKESGYLTADDSDASSASFSWPQREGGCSGDPDCSSYTSNGHHSYADAGNRGGSGGCSGVSNIFPPSTHHDLYHCASVPDLIRQEGGRHVRSGSSSFHPYCELMQLHPGLMCDQEPSVHYIPHQHSDPSLYSSHPYPPPAAPPITPTGRKRRQARGRGRSKDQNPGRVIQIQSDQITSSLRVQTGTAPKRTYRRRNCKAAASFENPSVRSSEPRRRSSKARQATAEQETNPGEKKIRHNEPLNQKAVSIMTEWYCKHEENPYPTKEEKERMAIEGGITTMQVKSWFANKRNRSNNTRPKVQKREMEEKLMQIYRKAAGHVPDGNNAFIIKELSQIIHTFDRDTDDHSLMDPEEEEDDN